MATFRAVRDEARPYRGGDGGIGVVMAHGFTSTVGGVLPWARGLAERDGGWPGVRVVVPRLPGHGTHWRDLARTRWWDWFNALEDAYLELAASCHTVHVAGLSMGGALALQLAARQPVAGTLLVNPSIGTRDWRVAPAVRVHRLLPSQRGIASDIAKPGVEEPAYSRFSVTSLATLQDLWTDTQQRLPQVGGAVLLMTSTVDHVVDTTSRELIRQNVPDVRDVELGRSYHVATLDHDAELIVAESRRFITAAG
ncbi:alpha/beta hydrolase [Tessaracoccus lubricantis]